MKKTLELDKTLLADARAACGASTDTETIRLALENLVRAAAYERLRALLGSEREVKAAPKRRERPVSRRRAA